MRPGRPGEAVSATASREPAGRTPAEPLRSIGEQPILAAAEMRTPRWRREKAARPASFFASARRQACSAWPTNAEPSAAASAADRRGALAARLWPCARSPSDRRRRAPAAVAAAFEATTRGPAASTVRTNGRLRHRPSRKVRHCRCAPAPRGNAGPASAGSQTEMMRGTIYFRRSLTKSFVAATEPHAPHPACSASQVSREKQDRTNREHTQGSPRRPTRLQALPLACIPLPRGAPCYEGAVRHAVPLQRMQAP